MWGSSPLWFLDGDGIPPPWRRRRHSFPTTSPRLSVCLLLRLADNMNLGRRQLCRGSRSASDNALFQGGWDHGFNHRLSLSSQGLVCMAAVTARTASSRRAVFPVRLRVDCSAAHSVRSRWRAAGNESQQLMLNSSLVPKCCARVREESWCLILGHYTVDCLITS